MKKYFIRGLITTLVLVSVFTFGSLVSVARVDASTVSPSLSDFIEILITAGIIPSDKVEAARQMVNDQLSNLLPVVESVSTSSSSTGPAIDKYTVHYKQTGSVVVKSGITYTFNLPQKVQTKQITFNWTDNGSDCAGVVYTKTFRSGWKTIGSGESLSFKNLGVTNKVYFAVGPNNGAACTAATIYGIVVDGVNNPTP